MQMRWFPSWIGYCQVQSNWNCLQFRIMKHDVAPELPGNANSLFDSVPQHILPVTQYTVDVNKFLQTL